MVECSEQLFPSVHIMHWFVSLFMTSHPYQRSVGNMMRLLSGRRLPQSKLTDVRGCCAAHESLTRNMIVQPKHFDFTLTSHPITHMKPSMRFFSRSCTYKVPHLPHGWLDACTEVADMFTNLKIVRNIWDASGDDGGRVIRVCNLQCREGFSPVCVV